LTYEYQLLPEFPFAEERFSHCRSWTGSQVARLAHFWWNDVESASRKARSTDDVAKLCRCSAGCKGDAVIRLGIPLVTNSKTVGQATSGGFGGRCNHTSVNKEPAPHANTWKADRGPNANVTGWSRPLASIQAIGECVQPPPIPRGKSGERRPAQQTKKRSDYAGLAQECAEANNDTSIRTRRSGSLNGTCDRCLKLPLHWASNSIQSSLSVEGSRWCGSDSRQTWQTLLTVRPDGSAFLVVHAVSRFSVTWARAGGTVVPCCRVYSVTSCGACGRLRALLRESLTVFDRTVFFLRGCRPFDNTVSGCDATSRHRWWLTS